MYIQYREPSTIQELESLFRLRYYVYSQDQNLHKMVSSINQDINWYDLNAYHFAAFENGNPIGYIRITSTSETHFTPWVKEIITSNNISLEQKSPPFPFQSYCPDSNWCTAFLTSLNGRKIGEVGKLAIHQNYRQGGVILNNLIDSFIHYCKNEQNFETGFGSCTLQLARFYRKFGFTIANDSAPFIYASLPEAVIVRFDKEN